MNNSADTQKQKKLRDRAEANLAYQNQPDRQPVGNDPRQLLHDLHVHQAELEMQNEELRRAQAELEDSRMLYRDLYDLAPIGYCTLDDEGLIVQANLTAATLLGVAREALVKQPIRRFIATEEQDTFHFYNQQLISTEGVHTCDLRMVKSCGSTFWVRLSSVCEASPGNKPVYRLTFGDITESKNLEEALRDQKSFFHLIAENLSDFIAVLDTEGSRLYNSPSYEQFFGSVSDLQGTNSFAEIHPDDRERVKEVFMETVRSGQGRQIYYRFVLADGSIRDMESRGSVIKDRDGQVVRVVVVSHDITERNRLLEKLHQMAFHDPLTQLPNRRLFGDRLSQAMAASTRSSCYGALMFLDLDSFKPLNDAYGHDVGDLLLIQVAERLKGCVREIDTVARFGGDEFVVMLGQLDMDEAESISQAGSIAEKLRVALAEPYILNIAHAGEVESVVSYRCTASIGVALFNHQETSQGAILKRADAAMYQAKHGGCNQVRFCRAQAA
ncbi:sensor domain-containing diguanylate cyclase [Dechloromonas sp.]|uniref:sensor domain-containing diguanylate cyclase n=1 Tax=Dechloromonas sp. TaxID=1917218 RepID=UPI00286DD181|nr:sensor domain-containing diguanylate cyclase [Dechloromonas sp.]